MIQPWILYALWSGLAFSIMALCYKKAFLLGTSSLIVNLFSFGIGFLIILTIAMTKWTLSIPSSKILVYISIGAVLLLLGNYLYVSSISLAPNPGFATALKTTDILFATFLGWMLFRGELSTVNFIGVLLVISGVFLIARK
jgi:uncharacterized membrane protein